MPSKQPSQREIFSARVKALCASCPKGIWSDPPIERPILEKLCSDDGLEGLRALANKLSDADFDEFIEVLCMACVADNESSKEGKDCKEALAAHKKCQTALGQARKSMARMYRYAGDVPPRHDLGHLDSCLRRVEATLVEEANHIKEARQSSLEFLTRKSTQLPYSEFIGYSARLMKRKFGQPHHKLVANMVEVFFNKVTNDQAVGKAAQNFNDRSKRANQRHSPKEQAE